MDGDLVERLRSNWRGSYIAIDIGGLTEDQIENRVRAQCGRPLLSEARHD